MNLFVETSISGLFRFKVAPRFEDERGVLIKPLQLDQLKQKGIDFECRESFTTFSKWNVLRGMHFQSPPHDHAKIVSCIEGEIFDVVVDLRQKSATYGKAEAFQLSGENAEALYIPNGCAHGFQVVSLDGAWMTYFTSKEHVPEADHGILWSSVPIAWPDKNPIVSTRDQGFPAFGDAHGKTT